MNLKRSKLDNANTSYQRKAALKKEIMEIVKKVPTECSYCHDFNGPVKKVGFHKFFHEKYKFKETSRTKEHSSITEFKRNLIGAAKESKEVREASKSTVGYVIDAIKAKELFSNIPRQDYPLLCMNIQSSDPSNLVVSTIPVSPHVIRPSVISEIRSGINEDDLTTSLMAIIKVNNFIDRGIDEGINISGNRGQLGLYWEGLQSQHALMINSAINLNPLPIQLRPTKPPRRSLVQRLKGKQGRFRQNLLGKRVNFTARSVISPDPNLRIDQVGIPIDVAKILTFPERVTKHNINHLKDLIRNGPVWPGANEIQFQKSGDKVNLSFLRTQKKRNEKAKEIRYGDVVMRHLDNTDVVLFNRQPSLHRQSMMAHGVKVMKWKTFRFNECVCAPYNADFDGDEMNVHLPQTAEAKAEAMTLMGVKSNTLTPRSGEPLVASIQDFITAMYLLTKKDNFFTHAELCRLVATIAPNHKEKITIPPPAIIKPAHLWTGKQVFSILLRPSASSPEVVNLNAKAKKFKAPKAESGNFNWNGKKLIGYKPSCPEFIPDDSWVIIRNSYLCAGAMDKSSLGSGSKKQVFYIMTRDYGAESAAQAMWRMCRIGPRYLSNRGFSIGIGDVWASDALLERKLKVIEKQYNKVDEEIQNWKAGQLQAQPGCTKEETLENIVQKELSEIRETAAGACFRELSPHNTPLNMALCGSKGSNINIAQMIACVGQQVLSGSRIPNGFEDRSLPHFKRKSKDPKARGFVKNSFFSGLTPTEFFFHTMGGREGLVDTAVKTASTGYMQRRLVKALEDLCCSYDGTVRNSHDHVVQFTYGQDQLDPQEMEGDSRPVDFERIWADCSAKYNDMESPSLNATEIRSFIDKYCNSALENDTFKSTDAGFYAGFEDFINRELPTFTNKKCDEIEAHWTRHNVKDKMYQPLRCIKPQIKHFVSRCALKYFKSRMEAGTCVGAICATSIGEPATQMTLKTFHFAGVASMNITQGVPRIEQIINNTTKIKTPIIRAELDVTNDKGFAQEVVSKIEKTTLGEICEYIEEIHTKMSSLLGKISNLCHETWRFQTTKLYEHIIEIKLSFKTGHAKNKTVEAENKR